MTTKDAGKKRKTKYGQRRRGGVYERDLRVVERRE